MRITETQIRAIIREALEKRELSEIEGLVSSIKAIYRSALEKLLRNDPDLLKRSVTLIRLEDNEAYEEFMRMTKELCAGLIRPEINAMTDLAMNLCSRILQDELGANDRELLRGYCEGLIYVFFKEEAAGLTSEYEYDTPPRDALYAADQAGTLRYHVLSQFLDNWARGRLLNSPKEKLGELRRTRNEIARLLGYQLKASWGWQSTEDWLDAVEAGHVRPKTDDYRKWRSQRRYPEDDPTFLVSAASGNQEEEDN